MLKTVEPQGQTCSGPSVLRSEPKTSGSFFLLKIDRVGRRSRTVCLLEGAPRLCSITRLTARSLHIKWCRSATTRRMKGTISTMTTIVAIQTDEGCVIAADSQITEDNLRTISLTTPKIVSVGKYLLAISGDSRPGDILAYNWKIPAYRGEDPTQFMGKKIIPSIIETFRANGYEFSNADKDKEAGFDYLFAFNGLVYHIACDLSFLQSEYGIYGIGSGGQFALGYLYSSVVPANITLEKATKLAKHAVEIASVLDINSCPPIQLVTQTNY